MRVPKTEIPDISPEEKSPLVAKLLGIIEQQSVILQLLVEEVQLLRDEIARLKNQKPKPKIPPSKLEKEPQQKKNRESKEKRPGSVKREKTNNLTIHETVSIAPEEIPPGSVFKVPIPRHPATQSTNIWPLSPQPFGHLIHDDPAGHSTNIRPASGA